MEAIIIKLYNKEIKFELVFKKQRIKNWDLKCVYTKRINNIFKSRLLIRWFQHWWYLLISYVNEYVKNYIVLLL